MARARKWTIVAVTAVVLGAALFLSYRQVPVYESKASVLVRTDQNENAPQRQANMATEKRLAESTGVARIARRALGLYIPPDQLLEGLSVNVPVDTEILEFHYLHPRPEEARRRAEGFAEAYLDYRRQQILTELLASQRSIQSRIDVLNLRLTELQGEAAGEEDPSRRAALTAEANSLITQIGILQQKLAEMSAPSDVSGGEIVERAETPTGPARPNHVIDGSLGLLLGLILGVGAGMVQDYADDRIREREELETRLAAPLLGTIPTIQGIKSSKDLLVVQHGDSLGAEAFRRLRTNLMFAATQRDSKVVLVTSSREQEGKTFTTANLGAALARAGKRVVLVSADLRRPRLEEVFEVPGDFGLVDVLMQEASLRSTLQPSGIENMSVLPSGTIPSNPTELLASGTMSSLLGSLREMADFVLIDSAPLLPVADAAVLVPACDVVLFVADARSATRRGIKEARQHLAQVDALLVGAVLLNARLDSISGYGYYYRQG